MTNKTNVPTITSHPVKLRASGRVEVGGLMSTLLHLDDEEKLFDFGICSVHKHHPDLLTPARVPPRTATSVPLWNTASNLSSAGGQDTPPVALDEHRLRLLRPESGFKCSLTDLFFSAGRKRRIDSYDFRETSFPLKLREAFQQFEWFDPAGSSYHKKHIFSHLKVQRTVRSYFQSVMQESWTFLVAITSPFLFRCWSVLHLNKEHKHCLAKQPYMCLSNPFFYDVYHLYIVFMFLYFVHMNKYIKK